MAEKNSYTVTVSEWRPGWQMRWRRMWALRIDGEIGTQSYANIRDADYMVRDYLNCMYDDDRGTDAFLTFRFDLRTEQQREDDEDIRSITEAQNDTIPFSDVVAQLGIQADLER